MVIIVQFRIHHVQCFSFHNIPRVVFLSQVTHYPVTRGTSASVGQTPPAPLMTSLDTYALWATSVRKARSWPNPVTRGTTAPRRNSVSHIHILDLLLLSFLWYIMKQLWNFFIKNCPCQKIVESHYFWKCCCFICTLPVFLIVEINLWTFYRLNYIITINDVIMV